MVVAESDLRQKHVDQLMVESVYMFSKRSGMSLRTLAKKCFADPSYFPKLKKGIIHYSDELDEPLARIDLFLQLTVLEKVTGGLFINPLRIDPEMDTTPSGLKERLSKNLEEATGALNKLHAYQKNPDRESVIETMYQMLDAMIDANLTFGAYRNRYGINQEEFLNGYRKHRAKEEGKR